jgi:hypothetical protein
MPSGIGGIELPVGLFDGLGSTNGDAALDASDLLFDSRRERRNKIIAVERAASARGGA